MFVLCALKGTPPCVVDSARKIIVLNVWTYLWTSDFPVLTGGGGSHVRVPVSSVPPAFTFNCPQLPSNRFVTASTCTATAFPTANNRFCRCSRNNPPASIATLQRNPWG